MKRITLVAALLMSAALVVLLPSTAEADDTPCTGTMTGGTFDNVVVPPGATCVLIEATVLGNVKALEDSRLRVDFSDIGGNVEGEDGYQCTNDGDCHLIVFAPFENRLYEMWRADLQGDTLYAGCQAIWRTDRTYATGLRGDVCTSADAAGFPIAPLLFTADEVAAGHIDHAIRFILPNDRVLARQYVRPASHGTRTTGGPNTPAYGVHFRLRADYPLQDLPNDAARVVARALQRYGMYHADGGEIALTAQSDRHSATTWEAVGLEPRDLSELRVEDFEVIHHSAPMSVGEFDCTRIDTP